MLLASLLKDLELDGATLGDCEVSGIAIDSRTVAPGDLFVALPGSVVDGAKFIPAAIEKGAVAVLTDTVADIDANTNIAVIRSSNPRKHLAVIAARFYTPQPEKVFAVTGTSGKTSVADFTRQLLIHGDKSAASIGTIGIVTRDRSEYGALTTPDVVTLHKTLQSLAHQGIDHLVMEASSHGLDQYRLHGVRLSAAAFTNLGRDHLDYHPDMQAYFEAKMRLFREVLPERGVAVINVDDAHAGEVIRIARQRGQEIIDVGRAAKRIRLVTVARDGFAQTLSIEIDGRGYEVRLPLVGDYQVSNALVASGLALAAQIESDQIVAGLATLRGVPGRLEIVCEHNGALLVVDYAHKPEALTAALLACRPFATGRLIVVFGCGGDRDKGKRPIMGRIAHDGADIVIVTDDNPRTEPADVIRAQILNGLTGLQDIGDRREAIRHAVTIAEAGDVVLVAGKGHETGQIVGSDVLPFSDHDELRRAMELTGK